MGIELIGSGDKVVAVVELSEGSEEDIGEVVREIRAHNKNVKTVIQEFPAARDEYRMKDTLKIVWGDKDTEVLHKEHGYTLRLDPMKVYFSPRESTVRQYVASQVKEGERVLIAFAGVGPYAIAIAKAQPKVKEVVAVEFNPDATRYMDENIRINRVSHLVTPIRDEMREACRKFDHEFDRVVMPMLYAKDYLDVAVKCAKHHGVIQAYMVSTNKDFEDSRDFVHSSLEKLRLRPREYEIANIRKIGMYAPGKWKILMDIRLK